MIKNLIIRNSKSLISQQHCFYNIRKKDFIAQDVIRSPEKYLLSSPIAFDPEAELAINSETGLKVNDNKSSYLTFKATKKLEDFSISKNEYLGFMKDNPNG